MFRRLLIPSLALIAALIACGTPLRPVFTAPSGAPTSPPPTPESAPLIVVTPSPKPALAATPSVEPTEPPAPPETSARIAALLGEVSAGRLYEDVFALAGINSRHVNSATIWQAAAYIQGQFERAGGRLVVSLDEFPLEWNCVLTTQANVIAVLPGSYPDAGIVLVGAHYDSRTVQIDDGESPAPGANDNASGTSVVIELARVLADETPRATLVFAAFSAEEVGKAGSTHYVEAARARGDDIRAVIALDIVGNAVGPSGEGLMRAFSADPPGSPSRQLARMVAVQGERYLPGLDVQVQPAIDRPYRYSDHVPFS